jgi:hypothetical protein
MTGRSSKKGCGSSFRETYSSSSKGRRLLSASFSTTKSCKSLDAVDILLKKSGKNKGFGANGRYMAQTVVE